MGERLRVRPALSGERGSRRMRAEDRLVETSIMQLPLAEPDDDTAQCPPGVRISDRCPHLLFAALDLLCEHSRDQILTSWEVPVDGRDAHARPPGDLSHGQVKPLRSKGIPRDRNEVGPVVLGIRPRFPSQCSWHNSHFLLSGAAVPFSALTVVRSPVAQLTEVLVLAVQFAQFGTPQVLQIGSGPEPHAGQGEIRIRVRAAGVSPVDVALRAGLTPSCDHLSLPHIPGVDAAGVVDEVGTAVTGTAVGDEGFGAVDVSRLGGASAEFAVLRFWAAKPLSMPWVQAGAAGTSIETATRALDALDVRAGQLLLIDGAAGGVGSVAVQLAIARGARVIGTGSRENQAFIEELGAIATTYGPGLPERVGNLQVGRVDRALDIAGAGSLTDLISITGTAASVLTIADFTGPQLGVRVSVGDFGGEPHGRHGLATAAALFEEGRFRIPIRATFPLTEAAQAHELAATGPRRGKIVLTIG